MCGLCGYGKQRRAYVILTVLLTDSWWYGYLRLGLGA